jgi:hypothetical protein
MSQNEFNLMPYFTRLEEMDRVRFELTTSALYCYVKEEMMRENSTAAQIPAVHFALGSIVFGEQQNNTRVLLFD